MKHRWFISLTASVLLTNVGYGQVLSLLQQKLTASAPSLAVPASRPNGEAPKWEVTTEFSYESLSNGFAPWYSAQLSLSRRAESGQTLYGSYRETSRFALHDREAALGVRQPFGKNWAVQMEAALSPTHRVLSKWTLLTQVERQLGRGWIVQAGFRHSDYNTARARLGIASVERYWSRYRAAYTLYVGAANNRSVSVTQRVVGQYFYGAQNSLGVGAAFGRELVNLDTRGLVRTNVRNVSVNGRHWFGARWAVSYGLTRHEQGQLYVRRSLVFGLHRQF